MFCACQRRGTDERRMVLAIYDHSSITFAKLSDRIEREKAKEEGGSGGRG